MHIPPENCPHDKSITPRKWRQLTTSILYRLLPEHRVDRLGELVFSLSYRLLPRLTNAALEMAIKRIIRHCQNQDSSLPEIVFICNGNICRSAYADLFTRQKLADSAGSRILKVTSAGLRTNAGKPADPQAISSSASRGVDLSAHVTSEYNATDSVSSLLLPMTLHQYLRIILRNPEAARRTICLGLLCPAGRRQLSIADPFGHDDVVFQKCFEKIEQGIEGLKILLDEIPS